MKKRNMILCLIFLLSQLNLVAQTYLTGKVTDKETGEEMIGASIVVKKNGVFIQGVSSNIDGDFNIRVDPAISEVEVSYTGYQTIKVTDIHVLKGQSNTINVQLKIGGYIYGGCGGSSGWLIPLITQDENFSEQKITSEQIRRQPTRNIQEISLSTPGVSFSQ